MTYDDKETLDEQIQIGIGKMLKEARDAESKVQYFKKQAKFYREQAQILEEARHRLWSAKEDDFQWHDPF